MKAKCTSDKLTYLTYGKVYEVIDKKSESVLIRDDYGCSFWYLVEDFQIIEDNPVDTPKRTQMKVKLRVGCSVSFFTDGKEYEVLDTNDYDDYLVVDDYGDEDWVDQEYFEIVTGTKEEPEEESKQLPLIMKFKVDSLLDSLLIQKALFEAGYSWEGSKTIFREKKYSYIFTDDHKNIWTSGDKDTYKTHDGIPSVVKSTLKIVEFVDNIQVEGYSVDRELLMEFLKKNGNEVSH